MHACIVEAHESTSKRLEGTLPKDHEHQITEKVFNSLSHYNLVHKFSPVPQAMKILDARSSRGQSMGEARKIAGLANDQRKLKSKTEVILEAQEVRGTVHFATLMDVCHLKNVELEPKKTKNTKAGLCSEVTW